MRKFIIALVACLTVLTGMAQTQKGKFVEVLYFHGKQRCATCLAMEKLSRETVSEYFANAVKSGKVRFHAIDISTPEGEALANKYKVTWSSLFVNKWANGQETRVNLTKFGFQNARSKPVEFKEGLKKEISNLLK